MTKEEKPAVLKKLVLTVKVLTPSGSAIAGASVTATWKDLPAGTKPKTLLTNDKGEATVAVVEPRVAKAGQVFPVELKVAKPRHGPIVPLSTEFTHKPATIALNYKPGNKVPFAVTGLPAPTGVHWGRPRIIGATRATLEVTLFEGGTLGRNHSILLARRLSAPHLPRNNPPEKISEIDEELIFHISHGDLALRKDIKVIHAKECPEFGKCSPNCTLELPPTKGSPPSVPKIAVRNNVAGGLRVMQLMQFEIPTIPGYKVGNTGMSSLNPRLVVGVVRLCKLLHNRGFNVMLTTGFQRAGDTKYHGPGRAIDFSGMLTDHPPDLLDSDNKFISDPFDPRCTIQGKTKIEETKKNKDTGEVTKSIVTVTGYAKLESIDQRDFIVQHHWGDVQLLVEKVSPASVVREPERGEDFVEVFGGKGGPNKLKYRFAEAPPASATLKHPLSAGHYKRAGELFQVVYGFFAKQFSHRASRLGPLPPLGTIGTKEGAPAPTADQKKLAQAIVDDGGTVPAAFGPPPSAAPLVPGAAGGMLLNPDYPLSDNFEFKPGKDASGKAKKKPVRREAHANHIHANFGAGRAGEPGYER